MLSFDKAFNKALNLFPYIYSAPTLKRAKLAFLDQVLTGFFGSINYKSLEKTVQAIAEANVSDDFSPQFITDQPFYVCGTQVEMDDGEEFPDEDSRLPGYYSEEELEKLTNVRWSILSNQTGMASDYFIFRNGFYADEDLIWKDKLPSDWIPEVIEYYTQAKAFFESEQCHSYFLACPPDFEGEESLKKDWDLHKSQILTRIDNTLSYLQSL